MELDSKYQSLIAVLEESEFDWPGSHLEPIAILKLSRENIEDVILLVEESMITDCHCEGQNLSADVSVLSNYIGKDLSLGIMLPVPNDNIAIVRSLADLLKYPQYLTKAPHKVYFIETKCFEVPIEYLQTISFVNVLKLIADHTEKDIHNLTCFFYDGVKISIPINYNVDDLHETIGIDDLKESLAAPRLKERIRMLRSSLIKVAVTAPSEELTFSHLLKSFKRLKTTYEQDWNFYISDFSLDELLEELEDKILNIAEKLNSALSDLQKTIITIPLAIIFAAPRIDTTSIQNLKNGIIVASVWIFALFTWTFLSNHKRTLKFISNEIEDYKAFVEKKHEGLSNRISSKFEGLEKRCSYQIGYRMIVGTLMWVAVLSLSLIFFTPQIYPYWGKIFSDYIGFWGGLRYPPKEAEM